MLNRAEQTAWLQRLLGVEPFWLLELKTKFTDFLFNAFG